MRPRPGNRDALAVARLMSGGTIGAVDIGQGNGRARRHLRLPAARPDRPIPDTETNRPPWTCWRLLSANSAPDHRSSAVLRQDRSTPTPASW